MAVGRRSKKYFLYWFFFVDKIGLENFGIIIIQRKVWRLIMPNLTAKGSDAMHQIIQHFTVSDKFSANDLSVKCDKKFVAATLNALAGHGLLIKHSTSPIQYSMTDGCEELFKSLSEATSSSRKRSNNDNLHKALKNKDDEFYTYYSDVEAEMKNYTAHFNGNGTLSRRSTQSPP